MHRPAVLNFNTDAEFARAAASQVGRLARKAMSERGRFDLAISGGESPRPVFSTLRESSLFPSDLWEFTHVFFVDERMVESSNPLSNVGNAHVQLLDHIPIPKANIHPMLPNIPDPASSYAEILQSHFHLTEHSPWPVFDLIALGMGSDGHTASLFPNSSAQHEKTQTVIVVPAPDQKPHVPRMTLTFGVLNAAREVSFWIRGSGKHTLIDDILQGRSAVPAAFVNAKRQSWYICPPMP